MKKVLLFIAVVTLASFQGCNALKKLTQFRVNQSTDFSVPSSLLVNVPISLPSPDITTNSSQTFANNNVEAIVQANRIIEKHNGYCTNLKQINQGTFAANVLFGSFMMNPFSDKQPFKKQMAEHFFDSVNFADSSLFVIKDMTLIFSDYFDFFADSGLLWGFRFFQFLCLL